MRFINRLLRALKRLPLMIYSRLNHVGYAKKIGVKMGDQIYIYGNPYKMFGTEPWLITLGSNVHITDNVRFVTHDGGTLILRHIVPDLELTSPIKIGNEVYIGVNSVVMPGVTIGNKVIIGAGSIVTRDIPDNSIAVGVPARVIKSVDDYLEKAKKNSLKLGHLKGEEKAKELKKLFNIS